MEDDKRLDRIENKIDKLQDHLSSIDSTLAAQHESLALHIKRTDLLEKKLEPVENHVIMINGILKFCGFIGILVGIIEGYFKITHG